MARAPGDGIYEDGGATAPLFTMVKQLWATGSLVPEYRLDPWARGQEALILLSLSSG